MSEKYELVKNYYDKGLWSVKRVWNVVSKGLITQDEFKLITGEDYDGN